MTGSANEAVETKEVETVAPRQLREFDAKLLQQLPDLSKGEMQHLIEHPDELRARLMYYGLGNITQTFPRSFLENYHNLGRIDSWGEFYAEEFQVDPDFSRTRLPDVSVFTYTTPIRVAHRLDTDLILDVIKKHGVRVVHGDQHRLLQAENLHMIDDVGRPRENYLASFSTHISEDRPKHSLKIEDRFRGTYMTLREHLLWIAYCLFCRDTLCGCNSEMAAEQFTTSLGRFALLGSRCARYVFGASFVKDEAGTYSLSFEDFDDAFTDTIRHENSRLVRRVKLWKSLPQI